jgi:hypothetical protein
MSDNRASSIPNHERHHHDSPPSSPIQPHTPTPIRAKWPPLSAPPSCARHSPHRHNAPSLPPSCLLSASRGASPFSSRSRERPSRPALHDTFSRLFLRSLGVVSMTPRLLPHPTLLTAATTGASRGATRIHGRVRREVE